MKTQILNHKEIVNKLQRIAWQILEVNHKEKEIVLAGIVGNGSYLAKELAEILKNISDINIVLTEVKIDKSKPFSNSISSDVEPEKLKDASVILVDDVLNSGKTMIYAVKYFLNGPLKRLNTVALVDRNHNRFPIKADFTGIRLSTSSKEHVSVELNNNNYIAYIE